MSMRWVMVLNIFDCGLHRLHCGPFPKSLGLPANLEAILGLHIIRLLGRILFEKNRSWVLAKHFDTACFAHIYIFQGNLMLLAKRPEAAAIAFRAAQNLRSDLRSYQGLVHSYLAFGKTKEALYTAREAMNAMPQSAKAIKLVGDVHASTLSGREKAKKFYESALRLEPEYLGAALALAELHLMEGRNGDAVSLLERYLKDWADDSLHVKLAQVFAATSVLQEALSHFQAALRINPDNEAAKKGLDRLEKQMKGIDPDAVDENDENDVDDVDGDTEEAELM